MSNFTSPHRRGKPGIGNTCGNTFDPRRGALRRRVRLGALFLLLGNLAAGCGGSGEGDQAATPPAQPARPVGTPIDAKAITISKEEVKRNHQGLLVISGILTNRTSTRYPRLRILYPLLNKSGAQIGSALAQVGWIDAQSKGTFSATIVDEKDFDRHGPAVITYLPGG